MLQVNSLGATTGLEMAVVAKEALVHLLGKCQVGLQRMPLLGATNTPRHIAGPVRACSHQQPPAPALNRAATGAAKEPRTASGG
jgi:hypothetical protein